MDTNSIALIQQFLAQHPEVQPFYQHHAPALMIAIGWIIREWHNLGGLPAIQAYCDGRDGGLVIWCFKLMLGKPKTIPPAITPESNQPKQ